MLSQKYPAHKKRAGVVEHLPSKCEALSSNPVLKKKREREREKTGLHV
jgi:hypothetical protein